MFNKLIRILVAIAIVGGLLFAAYTFLPLNLTGGVRQWMQETFDSGKKPAADAARNTFVATYDPQTKRTVASKVTYKDLMEKNCNSVSWYVKKKTATYAVVEVNGYKVARIRNIEPKNLKNVYTLTVSTGDSSGTVNYSVMNYCKNVLNSASTSDNLKNVVKAIYLYSEEANKYFI